MTDEGRIIASSSDGVATIAGEGDLTLFTAEVFIRALEEAIASGGGVTVDFRNASYIDSAIIAALIGPARILLDQGSRLNVIVTEGAHPQYVLNLVGFKSLMNIEAS